MKKYKKILALILVFSMLTSTSTFTVSAATDGSAADKGPGVAEIVETGKRYETLDAAVADANTMATATIEMLADVTLSEKLTISKNVTIKGAQTLTRGDAYTGTFFEVTAGATLTLDGGLTIDGGNEWTFDKTGYETDRDSKKQVLKADYCTEVEGKLVYKYVTPAEGAPIAEDHMILVGEKGNVNLKKVTIRNEYGKNAGVVRATATDAVVTLDGATITHLASMENNGVVVHSDNANSIVMNKGTVIDGNYVGGNHGLFKLYSGSVMTMNGGEIKNTNGWNSNGVAVGIYGGSEFIMKDGLICGNSSVWGQDNQRNMAVNVHSNSKMTMSGGMICHNIGKEYGGGISSYKANSTVIISGGLVVNNFSLNNDSRYGAERGDDLDTPGTVSLTGGIFGHDVSGWCAPGYVSLPYDRDMSAYCDLSYAPADYNKDTCDNDYIVVPGYMVSYYLVEMNNGETTEKKVNEEFLLIPVGKKHDEVDLFATRYYHLSDDQKQAIKTWYTSNTMGEDAKFDYATKVTANLKLYGETWEEMIYVAEIVETGKQYLSIADAVNAAESGQTVKVLKDHEMDVSKLYGTNALIFVNGNKVSNLTIDFNGKTVTVDTGKNTSGKLWTIFYARFGTELIITGDGTVNVVGDDNNRPYMFWSSASTIAVENGTYILDNSKTAGASSGAVSHTFYASSAGTIYVKDGLYLNNGPHCIGNLRDGSGSKIVASGGTYDEHPVEASQGGREFTVADGYTIIDNGNGTWSINPYLTVIFDDKTMVAGNSVPELTYTIDYGYIGEGIVGVLVTDITVDSENNIIGTVTLTNGSGDAKNYTARIVPGKLTVKEAVCEANGVYFDSIENAIRSGVAGEAIIVTVMKDHNVDTTNADYAMIYTRGRHVTLDLNGKIVTFDFTQKTNNKAVYASIYVSNGSNMIIKDSVGGGKLYNKGLAVAGNDARIVWIASASTLTIEGGSFITEQPSTMFYTSNSNKDVTTGLYIKNGYFEQNAVSEKDGSHDFFNQQNGYQKQIIELTGGTYNYDFRTYFENSWEVTIPEGYTLIDNGNGTWSVNPYITITFNDQTMLYGEEVPELTYTVDYGYIKEEVVKVEVDVTPITNPVNGHVITGTVTLTDGTGKAENYAVKIVEGKLTMNVCMIVETGEMYESLVEAVADANEMDKATIKMLADVTLGEKLTINKDITIEGEFTITRAAAYTGTFFSVDAGATLTLDGGLTIDGGNNYTFDKDMYAADAADWNKVIAKEDSAKWFTPVEGAPVATAFMITTTGGTVNLNKVTVQNNYSTNSGVISAGADSIINLTGAKITHVASTQGNGVVAKVSGSGIFVTVNEGTVIDGNHVGGNHGLFMVYSGATLTMNGGTISNNTGWNSNGTVVGVYWGTFNLNGGTICSNTGVYGPSNGRNAVIYLHSGHNFKMTGGTVCHNSGRSRGGIDAPYSNGTAIIEGGNVLDNISRGNWTTNDVLGTIAMKISGGIYTQDVNDWCAPGYVCLPYDRDMSVYCDSSYAPEGYDKNTCDYDYIVVPGYKVSYYTTGANAETGEATTEFVRVEYLLIPADKKHDEVDLLATPYIHFSADGTMKITKWYTDEGMTSAFDYATEITGNINLYGNEWEPITYTIKYNAGEGIYVGTEPNHGDNWVLIKNGYSYNESVTLHKGEGFQREGYKLVGWTISGVDYELGKPVEKNFTNVQGGTVQAYAIWEIDEPETTEPETTEPETTQPETTEPETTQPETTEPETTESETTEPETTEPETTEPEATEPETTEPETTEPESTEPETTEPETTEPETTEPESTESSDEEDIEEDISDEEVPLGPTPNVDPETGDSVNLMGAIIGVLASVTMAVLVLNKRKNFFA